MMFLSDAGGLYGSLILAGYLFNFLYNYRAEYFLFLENDFKVSSKPSRQLTTWDERLDWWSSLRHLKLSPAKKLVSALLCCFRSRETRRVLSKG